MVVLNLKLKSLTMNSQGNFELTISCWVFSYLRCITLSDDGYEIELNTVSSLEFNSSRYVWTIAGNIKYDLNLTRYVNNTRAPPTLARLTRAHADWNLI